MIRAVVVDHLDVSLDLFAELQLVLDVVEQASEEYVMLCEANAIRASRYGFEYLNSVVFAETRTRLSDIEDRVIDVTPNAGPRTMSVQ